MSMDDYRIEDDPEFRDMAIAAAMDIGLTEDEAEMQVDDYIAGW